MPSRGGSCRPRPPNALPGPTFLPVRVPPDTWGTAAAGLETALSVDLDRSGSSSAADWHDAGSDLFGPPAWARILAVETARCKRYGRTATAVIVEVPGLDEVAAVWGADVAALVLARVGKALASAARSSDHVARIAPTRFGVLLPETTEVAAVNFVERARTRCDEALRATDERLRCRFGWADAKPSRSLDVAATVATARLASDH
jgi:diguanylate cyclase (GGDEF)-like protein